MIFQDPMTSLNPVQRIDGHVTEAIQVHEPQTPLQRALERARDLAERLGIRAERLDNYPHQLSGGMRQRVMISLGLVLNAELVVADEATTSLDVIVEANLLDQLRALRDDFGVSILLITHNIALVAEVADRIAVMYAGRMAEIGSVYEVFDGPCTHAPAASPLGAQHPPRRRGGAVQDARGPPNLTHPPAAAVSPALAAGRCPSARPSSPRSAIPAAGAVQCWLYARDIPAGAAGREVSQWARPR